MLQKAIVFLLVFSGTLHVCAQEDNNENQTILKFQQELTADYLDPEKSPLNEEDLANFKGHHFFEIDTSYSVIAKFTRSLNAVPFRMKTTTRRLPVYEKFGTAEFKLSGQTYTLEIYQSHSSRDSEEYKDYLFLPFTDATNGHESYAGGRFIDVRIPEGNTIKIDFNKAYNPYCAYNKKYSCPIPPEENRLNTPIRAGVKKPKK